MHIDPYIFTFSALTVLATIWMGFWSAKRSKTAHDFFVAGRSVSVGWNASAISGEYLSAASFMGVAGMVMSSGYDALWYPVCYACGYLFLLLFIAGPLRRFGAYTIPDFAEGRFDSPLFRKIAVVFVLFIGFFYTMPQMKGAGTTLAYIFPGLPYWAGVVLVGAVITLNVALGGMKGITLVQAFQYWAKMFAISVPIFVLMAVYGHYGKQVGLSAPGKAEHIIGKSFDFVRLRETPVFYANDSLAKQAQRTYERLTGQDSPLWPIWTGITNLYRALETYRQQERVAVFHAGGIPDLAIHFFVTNANEAQFTNALAEELKRNGLSVIHDSERRVFVVPSSSEQIARDYLASMPDFDVMRRALPAKAPPDETWLNPFGPLTTKAAKAATARQLAQPAPPIALKPGLSPDERLTVSLDFTNTAQALAVYADLTGRQLLPRTNAFAERLDAMLDGQLSRWRLVTPALEPDSGARFHGDGPLTAGAVKQSLEAFFRANGLALLPVRDDGLRVLPAEELERERQAAARRSERRYALLYTYSLIIALVCGTAGLPHILVRFYTNPDGVAAKRTTMWVMILIGVFYLFPPVFGVMGRNLLPDLYAGAGAKGTDKVVLELPRIVNEQRGKGEKGKRGDSPDREIPSSPLPPSPSAAPPATKPSGIPWGSILSGITCAGAFAAFMSTFSGLLVSMTGAMAHDVYGRMFNPKSTPQQRLRAFKISAVVIGGVAILLGMQVEPLQINFMVGQAFAIAAASYFPLLFMSAWWRGMTMKGAATGMLTGGICALAAVTLTNFSDLGWWKLAGFWAAHPLLRILCEQPALWTVPLAIGLMVVVSKLTRREVPADIRMKMLVLHAPEKLGLKQEYIQEHAHGH